LGRNVERGRAVYVSAEDELAELHRRLYLTGKLAPLGDLILVPLAGKDAVLAAPDRNKLLRPTDLFTRLCEEVVQKHRPDLLVLDTSADLFGGDEINRVHVRQFVGMLRGLALDLNVTVLLLSHPSKAGLRDGDGSSGSTAWNNSVRSRLYLERRITFEGSRAVETDGNIRILRTMKANRAASGGQIVLRYDDGLLVREQESTLNARDTAHHAQRVFLALLEQFTKESRRVCASPGTTYAPAVFSKHPNAQGVTRPSLDRAMNRLLECGRVRVEETGPASRRRTHLVICTQSDVPDLDNPGDYNDEKR
jgi:RecA-family ATPase